MVEEREEDEEGQEEGVLGRSRATPPLVCVVGVSCGRLVLIRLFLLFPQGSCTMKLNSSSELMVSGQPAPRP